jgi:hypothetical protein
LNGENDWKVEKDSFAIEEYESINEEHLLEIEDIGTRYENFLKIFRKWLRYWRFIWM